MVLKCCWLAGSSFHLPYVSIPFFVYLFIYLFNIVDVFTSTPYYMYIYTLQYSLHKIMLTLYLQFDTNELFLKSCLAENIITAFTVDWPLLVWRLLNRAELSVWSFETHS